MVEKWRSGDPERRVGQRDKEYELALAAKNAAKVVSDAAAIAVAKVADAAAVAQSIVNLDLNYIKQDISEMKLMLENKFVTKDQFWPVRAISFGLVSLILIAVVGSLLAVVIIKK